MNTWNMRDTYMKRSKNGQLHIALIGHKHVPSREGGVEVVVWELAQRLRDAGYEVDCYNRSGYRLSSKDYDRIPGRPGVYRDNIRIITVPTVKKSGINAFIYTMLATIRAMFGHYDVIHFHAEGPCLMLWLPKMFGIRCIVTIHGLDWQRAKWGGFATRVILLGERIAARHADEVIVLSRNVQQYFLERYGRTTHYIPNGISRPQRRAPQEITQQYGLQGNDYIMTLSRIVPEKGIHYLIEAFKGVQTDKRLVIVGGAGGAWEYYHEIERMAAEDPRIIMAGFCTGQRLEELLSNMYLFALPSDLEGMSISLLEAMSYGQACLVSDIEENTEVTGTDGAHAVTFHKGDVEDLRRVLQDLVDHEDKVIAQRETAQDYICDKYSWDRMTEANAALYRG